MNRKICAIVVTYNIGKVYKEHFICTLDEVEYIVIVDNNSDKETIEVLKEIERNYREKVKIFYQKRNIGLAKAQNLGIKWAISHGFKWILLLDHDSYPMEGMVKKMLEFYKDLPPHEKERIGILAAKILDRNSLLSPSYLKPWGKLFFRREGCQRKKHIDTTIVIASGSLIRTEIFKKVGLMKEDFFIDFIDADFCLRTKLAGYKIIVVCDAVLSHTLGERKVFKLLFLKISPTNHSPKRRFFIYRNRVIVWKLYWKSFPHFVLFDFLAAIYDIVKILLFENKKKEKLFNIAQGLKDGLGTS